tara:strand:+ start:1015 stop:1194 length:180 start_codon:yes stop_codon:yes gene_type:complete
MKKSKSTELPSNRDIINKIENDLTLLRGEVLELRQILLTIQQVLKIQKIGQEKTKSWFG